MTEHWYNTSYHASLKSSPFKVLYGYTPGSSQVLSSGKVHNEEVAQFLRSKNIAFALIYEQLLISQNRMKFYADHKRTDREFVVGDEVFLKFQPYRQSSVVVCKNLKLAPRYFRPFTILARVGQVAYKLDLP